MIRTFCSIDDLTSLEFDKIFKTANLIQDKYKTSPALRTCCQGNVLTNVFCDASTRTISVLQSAMAKLGGTTINPNLGIGSYYVSEMEEFEDLLLSFEAVSDILAIRHKDLNLSLLKARVNIPVINSLCGSDEHSLYALGRAYSLFNHFEKKKRSKIGFYGGINFSRPAKSLVKFLNKQGFNIYIDSIIEECKLNPSFVEQNISNSNLIHYDNLQNFIGDIDALFIIEGMLQEGLDNLSYNKYISSFSTITDYDLRGLKVDSFISYGMPTKVSATKETIVSDLKLKYFNNKLSIFQDWTNSTMSLIAYLLEVNIEDYID